MLQVNYQVTPEGVQQTFAERPHVHRAFLANVPAVMDEKAFWTRFFKNEINRQVSMLAILYAGCAFCEYEAQVDSQSVHNHVQTIKHCSAFEACLVLLHVSGCLLSQPATLHASIIQWHYMHYFYHITSQVCWSFCANPTFKHVVADHVKA